MALLGIRPFIPTQGILALEKILLGDLGQSQVVVLDVNWQRYFSQFDSTTQPILAEIATYLHKSDKLSKTNINNEFVESLIAANSENRYEILSKYLETEVRAVMGINMDVIIDRTAGLSSMGMDSLMAVEFRNRITRELGGAFSKALPATLMFNYPNIEALTKYLLEDVLAIENKTVKIDRLEEEKLEMEKIMADAKSVKDDVVEQELLNEILKAKKNLIDNSDT
jgi:hypothetical protein